jgi:hypothetical protein
MKKYHDRKYLSTENCRGKVEKRGRMVHGLARIILVFLRRFILQGGF